MKIYTTKFSFSLFFISLALNFFAQVPGDAVQQQNQHLEFLTEQNQSENDDYTSLTETFNQYYKHPLNLNTAGKEELLALQLLSEIQINNLLRHIETNGKLLTLYELQGIEGFDVSCIKKIQPYVKVSELGFSSHFSFSELLKNGRHEIVNRYQQVIEYQEGYKARTDSEFIARPYKYYIGSPAKIYSRYSFNYNNTIRWGIIANKDAGESLKKIDSLHKKAGFDFYTAHFFIRTSAFIKTFALGDYQVSFGQGLVIWKGFSFGKSSSILSVKKNAMGIRAYNSADASRFLRGLATTLKFKKIETTVFYSIRKIDAHVIRYDTMNGLPVEISSITQGSSHATLSALQNKAVLSERIIGGNISYKGKKLSIGSTLQNYLLSADLIKEPALYNQYDFKGHFNCNAGIDFSYVHKNMNLFGEGAISQNSGKAFIGGLMLAPDPQLSLVALYRNFERNYQNTLALALSENTLPKNEKGFYLGMEAHLQKNIIFTMYIDQYCFPWLLYKLAAPGNGYDFFAQFNWVPTKKTEMYFRYHQHTKQENISNTAVYIYTVPVQQQNFRYNTSFQLLPFLKLHSRVEYLVYQKQGSQPEKGVLMFQDIAFKKSGKPLELTFRYALFDTDGYNSRMYSYENDMPCSFSIPALFNKGSRVYLLLDCTLNKHIELWARISQTCYSNVQVQNEGGLNQMNTPTKTEVKLQLNLH